MCIRDRNSHYDHIINNYTLHEISLNNVLDCLTDLVSVSGSVNVTVFAESPLLGLGVDIDVDLRICVMG